MTTQELARLKSFQRRKNITNKHKLTPIALIAILVAVVAAPVVVSDYISAQQELHVSKARYIELRP